MPSETALAARVVSWLEVQHWDVYQEVPYLGDVADIVAVRSGLVWVVECKKTLSLAVMAQAARWQTHYRSLAVPMGKNYNERHLAERICRGFLHVGILYVDEGDLSGIKEKVPAPLLRHHHKHAIELWAKLRPEHKTFAHAGSNRGGRWTPYKQSIAEVKDYLKGRGNEGATLREIADAIKNGHWSSPASARTCLRHALEKFEAETFEPRGEGRERRYYLMGRG